MSRRLVFVQSDRWCKRWCEPCVAARCSSRRPCRSRRSDGEWWLVVQGTDLTADKWKDFQTQVDGSRGPTLLTIGSDCLRQRSKFAFAVVAEGGPV